MSACEPADRRPRQRQRSPLPTPTLSTDGARSKGPLPPPPHTHTFTNSQHTHTHTHTHNTLPPRTPPPPRTPLPVSGGTGGGGWHGHTTQQTNCTATPGHGGAWRASHTAEQSAGCRKSLRLDLEVARGIDHVALARSRREGGPPVWTAQRLVPQRGRLVLAQGQDARHCARAKSSRLATLTSSTLATISSSEQKRSASMGTLPCKGSLVDDRRLVLEARRVEQARVVQLTLLLTTLLGLPLTAAKFASRAVL